ncbi:MAG: HAMP domain-containing sensor histidine kinase [Devosia sp.]|nr:HAMP domain-containing sensor histidine kinase [Devosia sp.]
MRVRLLRSTLFRTALLFCAIFLASLAIAAFAAQHLIRKELGRRLDQTITDTYNIISQSLGDSDIADLVASVQSFARTSTAEERIFVLADGSGSFLAGNIRGVPNFDGWKTLAAAELGTSLNHEYRAFSGLVGGYRLVVGSSFAETDAVNDLVMSSLAWAAALLVLMVIGAGVGVAIAGQRRLDRIAGIMRSIGQGQLAARIPVSQRGDDIDDLARQVNSALDRLAALVEGMRQVSVDIAHDLKTPLNRLAITIESAIEAERKGHRVADFLVQAQSESTQINATFEALLRIAQIEAGARRSRFTALALEPVLETIVEVYGDAALESGQSLDYQADPDLPPVYGDKELLTQLFANLVENALRHAGRGASVYLRAEARRGAVVVTVVDNGPGIPEPERQRVFRRLYRLDKSRSTPGSGLGLSLVKAVADLHGATVELGDDDPGLSVRVAFTAAPVASAGLARQPAALTKL